jgi:TDG/mug DNA glycosylase family protein
VAELKHSFPPVVDRDVRVLVLGSLPGERSLAQAQYYANPRNQFWRLIGEVIGRELEPLAYAERLAALLDAGIGLWDSVASATRKGSLDGNIRGHSANDLAKLAAGLPKLRAIGFNGGTSAALGKPRLAGRADLALVPLPSSSPAYTLPYSDKRAAWLRLADYL